ncbi:MAG: hypothetical protein ACR2OA_02150 [Rubripirellula sp.]
MRKPILTIFRRIDPEELYFGINPAPETQFGKVSQNSRLTWFLNSNHTLPADLRLYEHNEPTSATRSTTYPTTTSRETTSRETTSELLSDETRCLASCSNPTGAG